MVENGFINKDLGNLNMDLSQEAANLKVQMENNHAI